MHSWEDLENCTRPGLPQHQDQLFQLSCQREFLRGLFLLPFVTTLHKFPQDSLRPLRLRAVVAIVRDRYQAMPVTIRGLLEALFINNFHSAERGN